ncbi:MAG TPA: tetratricopeptide repeat protein [Burkholderiales bacterium]
MKTKAFMGSAVLILLAPLAALAADSSPASSPGKPVDPVLEKVSAATAQQDWTGAQSILREALARDPRNADYHNLYAYSIRKGPNPDMSAVFKHYNEALAIDPKHRGAHEYLGEAYLMVGNLPKAKEELGTLDKLCFFPCDEFAMLKKAVADYETKQAAR